MGLRREAKVIRLTFGADDWIDVRAERLYGDTVDAQRAAASRIPVVAGRKGKDSEAAAQFDFDAGAFNLSLLTSMIVAWSDDAPINEATVKELPDDIVQEVLDVIFREDRTEDERDPLGKTSTTQSERPEASGSRKGAQSGPEK